VSPSKRAKASAASGPPTLTPSLEVVALVAAWSDDERRRRGSFTERVFDFAGAIDSGQQLRLLIRTAEADRLAISLSMQGVDVRTSDLRGLENLLGEPDSPVQVVFNDGPRTDWPPDDYESFALRRASYSADTPSRLRPLTPSYDPLGSLRGLCAALLEQGNAGVEVVVGPPSTRGKSPEQLAREAIGPDRLTPETLAETLRSQGTFVQSRVRLSCRDQPTPRLLAELRTLGSPIEISPTDVDRSELLGSRGLAALMRLPVTHAASFPGLPVVPAPFIRAPQTISSAPVDGALRLGSTRDAMGYPIDVRLPIVDFSRHMYVPGQTGAGKSTMLRSLACEVASLDQGLLFVDPHGEAARQLVRELPARRARDVYFIDASDLTAPAPINPFAVSDLLQRDTALANVTAMFYDLFDPHQQGIVGPRWESWFRMAMLTLIAAKGRHASLLDVPRLFLDKDFLQQQRAAVQDQYLIDFWDQEMAQTNAHTRSEVLGWFTSKFTAFRTNAVLREVLGSGRDSLDPSEVMDEGKIVVVSLQKGEIGAPISQMLGYLYLTRYWSAALKRRSARPFVLFVDEAQTFAKGSLPDILAEGRKFGLFAVIANQYLEQLPESLQHALLGNVGTVLGFRMGDRDAEQFAGRLGPEFASEALRRLPNHQAASSMLLDGAVQPAFTLSCDHFERVSHRRTEEMERQADAILKRSQAYFKRAIPSTRRTRQRGRTTGSEVTAAVVQKSTPNGRSRARRPVQASAADQLGSRPPSTSFVEAFRARIADDSDE